MKAKKLVLMGLLTALALIIFTVEAQIPLPLPVPGVKLGLSNIITVFAVFVLGPAEGILILTARVILGAVFAGNFSSIFYSAAGGALAIIVTIVLKKILTQNQIWISGVWGAMAHCVGQMAAAILITATPGLAVYLPVMLLCAMVTGTFTGLCAQLTINRGDRLWRTFLN